MKTTTSLKVIGLFILGCLALFSITARAQFPSPDFPALPDGGSLCSTAGNASTGNPAGDGGGPSIVCDTGQVDDWNATVRCSSRLGSPRVHARWSADGGIATAVNQLYEVDRTFDFRVLQPGSRKLRYISFLGEDGGPPACNVQTQVGP